MFTKRSAHPISSLKTALFFISLVVLILGGAMSVKVFQTIQKSVFDGQHQFVLLIQSPKNTATLVALDPTNSVFSVLYISDPKHDNIQTDIPIGIDATMQIDRSIQSIRDVQDALLASAFSLHRQSPITWYDVLRLYIIAKTMNSDAITEDHITVPADQTDITTAEKQFIDQTLQKESLPIQIINASDITGKASNLETLLTNTGCSVIDVRTSSTIVSSSIIRYYGTMSYTVQKLHHILGYPISQTNEQMIGAIQIVIGKDGNRVASF